MTSSGSTANILLPGPGFRPFCEGDALDFHAPFIWTIDALFSPDECAALIDRIETIGPERAPITTGRGFVMDERVRNNTRSMFDDPALAQRLFERVRPFVPGSMCGGAAPVGLNERWRCYRYTPGQFFAPHYDGAFVRNDREGSRLTFILYLNDGFEGGETAFPDFDITVRPRTGQALLFQHALLHESTPILRGNKYAARSDVMYRKAE